MISIPSKAIDSSRSCASSTKMEDWRKLTASLFEAALIKKWIFTISYAGESGIFDKFLCRQECFQEGAQRFKDFIEMLVVQEGSRQFDLYRQNFADTHIIVSLPTAMTININLKDEQYFAKKHGAGYARLFSQIFAAAIGLDAIWCLDDNIKRCYQLDPETGVTNNCSFKTVMCHIEAIFGAKDDHGAFASLIPQQAKFDSAEDDFIRNNQESGIIAACHHVKERLFSSQGRGKSLLQRYVGYHNAYGIIGTGRSMTQR